MTKHEGERCARPCVYSQYGGGVYMAYSSTLYVKGSLGISSNAAGEVSSPCVAFAYSVHVFCSFATMLLVNIRPI